MGAVIGVLLLDEVSPQCYSLIFPILTCGSQTLTAPKRVAASAHRSFINGTSTTIPTSTEETRLLSPIAEEVEVVKPVPPMSDLLTPQVISALAVYVRVFMPYEISHTLTEVIPQSFLALQTIALDALLILFCYTRISLGGLGFTESQIGQALAFAGCATVFAQVSLFPPLQKRFGTVRLYQTLMGLYPIIFGLFLVMSWVSKKDEGTESRRIWYVMGVFLFLKSMYVPSSPPCSTRLTTVDTAPTCATGAT